jgi:hypothetical protein
MGEQMVKGWSCDKRILVDVLQSGSWIYLLRDDKPLAYVFFCLVLASKFSFPPTTYMVRGTHATFELSTEAISVIMAALGTTWLLEWTF